MRIWMSIMLAVVLPHPSPPPQVDDDAASLVGVWEGVPERIASGGCLSSGALRPLTIEISRKADGVLVGDVTDLEIDKNWTGRIANGQVMFDAPRNGECNGRERNYVLALTGEMPVSTEGAKTLTLTGTDEPCPALQCRFRYTVTFTQKRVEQHVFAVSPRNR
jgi:hypothetical protein